MDYKLLNEKDPGGPIDDAFASLRTMSEVKMYGERVITERTIIDNVGSVDGEKFLEDLKIYSQQGHKYSKITSRVLEWLKPKDGGGMDIAKTESLIVLQEIVVAIATPTPVINKIMSMRHHNVLIFPELGLRHVIKERQMYP